MKNIWQHRISPSPIGIGIGILPSPIGIGIRNSEDRNNPFFTRNYFSFLSLVVPVQREMVKPKTSFAWSGNLSPTLYTVQTKPKLLHQACMMPRQVRIMLPVINPSPVHSIMPSQVPSKVPLTLPSIIPSQELCTMPSVAPRPSTAASAAFMQQTEVVDDHG